MTDQYFYIEEVSTNAPDGTHRSKPNRKKSRNCNVTGDSGDVKTSQSQEIRLHEIEQQLQMAESRCNKLKGQVDYMKLLYNKVNTETADPPKSIAKLRQSAHNSVITTEVSPPKRKSNEKDVTPEMKSKGVKYRARNDAAWKEVPEKENTSNICAASQHEPINTSAIVAFASAVSGGGEPSSEAVKSIGNIISGITNSVSKLKTRFHANAGSANSVSKHDAAVPVGIQGIKCIPRDQTAAEKPYQTDAKHNATEQFPGNQKSRANKKNKSRATIVSSKLSASKPDSTSSIHEARKKLKFAAKTAEKSGKLPAENPSGDSGQVSLARYKRKFMGKLRTQSSRTLITKKPNNRKVKTAGLPESEAVQSENLIELYHNSAIKMLTESDANMTGHNKSQKAGPSRSNQATHGNRSRDENCGDNPEAMDIYRNPLSPIHEQEPMREGSYCKSYYLPTIASKMKQVATNYYGNFTFRTIPFIAAKSTSPSHNLGVNIQQVLSIIKGRKPLAGISPTLAYNIEIAATKLGSRPLSALVSNLGSRMVRNPCPLNRRYPNYNHLEEMARDIPEETMEEINNVDEEEDEAEGQDMQEQDWTVNPKSRSEKCTCVPKSGVKFNEVYNKYVPDEPQKLRQYAPPVRRVRKPWNPGGRYRDEMQRNCMPRAQDIAKREQSLKVVLKNLHDEFAHLNERYDELKLEVNNGNGTQDIVHELEKLETELQNKEDEITMVMSLYKEVLNLKQQVRVLKKRASQSTVVVSPVHRYRDSREQYAAGHLTSLLRHIQQFQESLKNEPIM